MTGKGDAAHSCHLLSPNDNSDMCVAIATLRSVNEQPCRKRPACIVREAASATIAASQTRPLLSSLSAASYMGGDSHGCPRRRGSDPRAWAQAPRAVCKPRLLALRRPQPQVLCLVGRRQRRPRRGLPSRRAHGQWPSLDRTRGDTAGWEVSATKQGLCRPGGRLPQGPRPGGGTTPTTPGGRSC